MLIRLFFGVQDFFRQGDLVMCPTEDDGWEIHHERRLISHQSGFKAEFRDASIYSIKQFPYEATIHDIRNWVLKAESRLARLKQVNQGL
jgi:hypothetical protein